MKGDRIIWQPKHLCEPGGGIDILINPAFARKAYAKKLTREEQAKVNELGLGQLKRFKYNYPHPYAFIGDSYMPFQINLGFDGRLLILDQFNPNRELEIKDDEPLTFSPHNIDLTGDAYALMTLVDMWTKYIDVFKGD